MAIFRVEKTRDYIVMAKHHLKDKSLSLKSKGLLTMMLSLPEEWDYSTRGLAAICKEGVESIGTALKELENAGYIRRNRLRDEKGRIYDTEYVIYEKPQKEPDTASPDTGKPHTGNPYMDKPDTDEPCTENRTQYNNITNQVNKKINIDELNINQSIRAAEEYEPDTQQNNDRIDGIDIYREIIKENIDYDIMCQRYGRDSIDEVLELILETVCSTRKVIRIAGNDFPAEVVKSRMLKVDSSHVEYLLDCLKKNTTKVRNIKAYMLTAIYNSPVTIDSYYRAEVNHDMYGGD